MNNKLHIIYVPGLGKARPPVQSLLIKTWRLWGVESELIEMDWGGKEPWKEKRKRLSDRIDAAAIQGKSVALVAASAGASAALDAYATKENEVTGVMLISGMVNHPEKIGESYRRRNVAFAASTYDGVKALAALSRGDRGRIVSTYALLDEFVAPKYSKVEGARNHRSPTIGHVMTIGFQILFGAPLFIRSLKRQARETV